MEELHTFTGHEPPYRELVREIYEKTLREGIEDFSAFSDMVDETVEEKTAEGYFSGQEDLEAIKEELKLQWNVIREKIASQDTLRMDT